MIKVAVPAGIGDVSWIWSKLSTIPDEKFTIYTPETWPMRTYQWLKLLPGVVPGIGQHDYNTIVLEEARRGYSGYTKSWKEIMESYGDEEVIYLQPNQHFLDGKPLSLWIPDLKTDFHYPIVIGEDEAKAASELMGDYPYNLGIHMATIKGVRAWRAWLPEDWVIFIKNVKRAFPEMRIVLLGGSWDMDMGMELQGLLPKIKMLDLIGRTTIGQVITILKELSYYIGYSSGLNVMCNVLNIPCTALWPDWQRAHMYPHADPEMVDNRTYRGFVYDDPRRIFTRVRDAIKSGLEDSHGG